MENRANVADAALASDGGDSFSGDGRSSCRSGLASWMRAALMWLAINDQFVHGWDLARAIGHDTNLDPGLADELLVRGQAWITDAYRGPDGARLFGLPAKAPGGGSPADRLAAFLGRSM